jgi:predicted phage tail component-like protein
MAIKFNNVDIPAFVKVNDIKVSALPPVSQTTLKVNGRAGSYDFGNQLGEREIEVTVSVIADNPSDLKVKIRQFAKWLYHEDAKEFVILDEADKYYMAKFTGDSKLDEILRVGQGTISFVCTNPYAYSNSEQTFAFNPTDEVPYGFVNNGGIETYPKMSFEFTQDTTNFSVMTDEQFLLFGQPANIDATPKDTNPLVMNETFDSLTGWTSATNVDGGIVNGTFKTNGYSISLDNIGEGAEWHGASMVKGLPTEPLQDFKIRTRMGLKGDRVGQLGRVELYFLDINGNQIGKIALRNGNPKGITPYAQVRLGGDWILQTYGDYAGVWKGWYDGFMDVERKGNQWHFYYAIYDPKTGREHTRKNHYFVDVNNLYMNKVAQVQVHIGAHGTADPIDVMYIQHIKVWDYQPTTTEDEVPYIFKVGDVLVIDNETGEILLNGQPYYEDLDPASKFIKLEKGANGITASPANITTNGEIKFRERWL